GSTGAAMMTSNVELDLGAYLCLVDANPDPDPPHDAARPTTTWRDHLPGVFALVIGGLVAVVVAGAGFGAAATSGSGRSTVAPPASAGGTSIAAAALSPSTGAPAVASAPLGTTRAAQFQLDPGITAVRVRAVD